MKIKKSIMLEEREIGGSRIVGRKMWRDVDGGRQGGGRKEGTALKELGNRSWLEFTAVFCPSGANGIKSVQSELTKNWTEISASKNVIKRTGNIRMQRRRRSYQWRGRKEREMAKADGKAKGSKSLSKYTIFTCMWFFFFLFFSIH